MEKFIVDYDIFPYDVSGESPSHASQELEEELNIMVITEDLSSIQKLNEEQCRAYNTITDKILSNIPGAFFIDGPGDSGKTFLYQALLAFVRSKVLTALATTWGITAHSRFKIPLEVDKTSSCSISKRSTTTKLLQLARLIIWDEALMCRKESIEAFDRLLQDLHENELPFGGKVVILGGDFRQVLTVVSRGNRNTVIEASLVTSYLWPILPKITLVTNMCATQDAAFSEFLLRIGSGDGAIDFEACIELPTSIVILYIDGNHSLDELLDLVFPDIGTYHTRTQFMINRDLPKPRNEYVDVLNNKLIDHFKGEPFYYFSFDEVIDLRKTPLNLYFFYEITPSGFPPHELVLKKNCPVMLLRNINLSDGLCNETRLIYREFGRNIIDAKICTGDYSGKRVFLSRIPFVPLESERSSYPFKPV